MPTFTSFTQFKSPNGKSVWIPDDIELRIPKKTSLDPASVHFLIYIPWHDYYLKSVDPAYLDFFKTVLPTLHVRTTNVHVTTCLPFIKDLIKQSDREVDERVVQIAFMLHDSGWSRMSEMEIAHSLGVQGLSLSGEAVNPKERHVILGQQIAQETLDQYPFQLPLTDSQKDSIYQAILYHDKPWELAKRGELPASMEIVCNVDHLWSFTHKNFWQDTVRKEVPPDSYLENLGQDLNGYFVSESGRRKARQLLSDRRDEVLAWKSWAQENRFPD
jgi:hypothetical protein